MSTSYKTSDFLKDRHPYRDESFQQKRLNDAFKVFPSFGIDGLKRNIDALRDERFPIEEKLKALKILHSQISSSEQTRYQIIRLNIVQNINFLLEANVSEIIHEYCAKILEGICYIDSALEIMDRTGTMQLLVQIIKKEKPSYNDKCAACSCIRKIAEKRFGCDALLSQRRLVNDFVNIIEVKHDHEALLTLALDTLRLLCATPKGRQLATKCDVLQAVEKVLKRDQVFHDDYIQSTLTAVHLIWNVCLDDEGKEQGKAIIQTLGILMSNSMKLKHYPCQRLITGALSAILVDEDAKKQALITIEDTNLSKLLVNLLLQTIGDENKDAIKENTIQCLKLICEYPLARKQIHEELDDKPDLIKIVY